MARRGIDRLDNVIVCSRLVAELKDDLRRLKFRRNRSSDDVGQCVGSVRAIAEHAPDAGVHLGLTPDPDADSLVALAREAGADCLAAGDPHLADLPALRPPTPSPRAFPERLSSNACAATTTRVPSRGPMPCGVLRTSRGLASTAGAEAAPPRRVRSARKPTDGAELSVGRERAVPTKKLRPNDGVSWRGALGP